MMPLLRSAYMHPATMEGKQEM